MPGIFESVLLSAVAFIVVVGVVVTVHELGHFLAARALGTAVDRFSIGFGPPLLSFTRGGVAYTVLGSVTPYAAETASRALTQHTP